MVWTSHPGPNHGTAAEGDNSTLRATEAGRRRFAFPSRRAALVEHYVASRDPEPVAVAERCRRSPPCNADPDYLPLPYESKLRVAGGDNGTVVNFNRGYSPELEAAASIERAIINRSTRLANNWPDLFPQPGVAIVTEFSPAPRLINFATQQLRMGPSLPNRYVRLSAPRAATCGTNGASNGTAEQLQPWLQQAAAGWSPHGRPIAAEGRIGGASIQEVNDRGRPKRRAIGQEELQPFVQEEAQAVAEDTEEDTLSDDTDVERPETANARTQTICEASTQADLSDEGISSSHGPSRRINTSQQRRRRRSVAAEKTEARRLEIERLSIAAPNRSRPRGGANSQRHGSGSPPKPRAPLLREPFAPTPAAQSQQNCPGLLGARPRSGACSGPPCLPSSSKDAAVPKGQHESMSGKETEHSRLQKKRVRRKACSSMPNKTTAGHHVVVQLPEPTVVASRRRPASSSGKRTLAGVHGAGSAAPTLAAPRVVLGFPREPGPTTARARGRAWQAEMDSAMPRRQQPRQKKKKRGSKGQKRDSKAKEETGRGVSPPPDVLELAQLLEVRPTPEDANTASRSSLTQHHYYERLLESFTSDEDDEDEINAHDQGGDRPGATDGGEAHCTSTSAVRPSRDSTTIDATAVDAAGTFHTKGLQPGAAFSETRPADEGATSTVSSLSELERLLREQHLELASRGFLPADTTASSGTMATGVTGTDDTGASAASLSAEEGAVSAGDPGGEQDPEEEIRRLMADIAMPEDLLMPLHDGHRHAHQPNLPPPLPTVDEEGEHQEAGTGPGNATEPNAAVWREDGCSNGEAAGGRSEASAGNAQPLGSSLSAWLTLPETETADDQNVKEALAGISASKVEALEQGPAENGAIEEDTKDEGGSDRAEGTEDELEGTDDTIQREEEEVSHTKSEEVMASAESLPSLRELRGSIEEELERARRVLESTAHLSIGRAQGQGHEPPFVSAQSAEPHKRRRPEGDFSTPTTVLSSRASTSPHRAFGGSVLRYGTTEPRSSRPPQHPGLPLALVDLEGEEDNADEESFVSEVEDEEEMSDQETQRSESPDSLMAMPARPKESAHAPSGLGKRSIDDGAFEGREDDYYDSDPLAVERPSAPTPTAMRTRGLEGTTDRPFDPDDNGEEESSPESGNSSGEDRSPRLSANSYSPLGSVEATGTLQSSSGVPASSEEQVAPSWASGGGSGRTGVLSQRSADMMELLALGYTDIDDVPTPEDSSLLDTELSDDSDAAFIGRS